MFPNRKIVVFVFCVLLSVLFWLMSALTKEYVVQQNIAICYTNIPHTKIVSNKLPEELIVDFKSQGYDLLSLYFGKSKPVEIDFSLSKPTDKPNYYRYSTVMNQYSIRQQMGLAYSILKIYPDLISFNFNKKDSKRVPVKANLAIDFDSQYKLSDSIKIIPAFVDLYSSAAVLNGINFIKTEVLQIKRMNNSVIKKLRLVLPSDLQEAVELSDTIVSVEIPVSKFTEGEIQIPVNVVNSPDGITLKTFPDKVKITFLVSLKGYENVSPDSFKVEVDYLKIKNANSNKVKVDLVKFPKSVKITRVLPEKLEYIIRKND